MNPTTHDSARSARSSRSVPRLRSSPRRVRWAVVYCIAGVLAGCGEDELGDLQAYVTEVKSRKMGKIEPLPEFQTVVPYTFVAEGRRDPFARAEKKEENPERLRTGTGPQPDFARPKEELEAFELDSLRMVGTIRLQTDLWGLVKAADGTIHRVRPGHHLGRNYGRIVQIKPDRIDLVELVSVSSGSWEERPAALDLNETPPDDAGRKTR